VLQGLAPATLDRSLKFHFSKSVRLEKDNIQAKYETLKTQINPHFLFNSLNSLTNLVDDNEKAVEYIGNLSEEVTVKAMLADWEQRSPGRADVMFRALQNVSPSWMLLRILKF